MRSELKLKICPLSMRHQSQLLCHSSNVRLTFAGVLSSTLMIPYHVLIKEYYTNIKSKIMIKILIRFDRDRDYLEFKGSLPYCSGSEPNFFSMEYK